MWFLKLNLEATVLCLSGVLAIFVIGMLIGSFRGPRGKPKIIVLCGSSKFVDRMAVCSWLLERDEGAITMGLHLLPWWYATENEIPDHLAEHEGVADQMDQLHMRKIDLADEVFIVNSGHYIGDSTRAEIEYAKKKSKPLRWYTHDEIGFLVERILDFHKEH